MKKTSKKKAAPKLTSKQKVAKLRSALVKACNAHLKQDGKIISGGFTDMVGGCCPVQCVVGPEWLADYSEGLSQKLGFKVSNDDLWDFVYSFDGVFTIGNKPMEKLGRELRQKYIKENK